jgi:hypothetical protein
MLMWEMTSIQWVNDEHDGYVRLIYIERQPWWEETGYDVSVRNPFELHFSII